MVKQGEDQHALEGAVLPTSRAPDAARNTAPSVNAVRRVAQSICVCFWMIAAACAKRGYRRAAKPPAQLMLLNVQYQQIVGPSSAYAEKTYPRESRFVSAGG